MEERGRAQEFLAAENWLGYLGSFHEGDLLNGFRKIAPAMADEDYWFTLRSIWKHADFVYRRLRAWRALYRSSRPGRHFLMTEDERDRILALPKKVKVYRGFRAIGGQDGLSWTLSREVAIRFAQGKAIVFYNMSGGSDVECLCDCLPMPGCYVAHATIARERVVAYFEVEQEVIVANFRGYVRHVEQVPNRND